MSGGASKVVSITMATMAENVSAENSGSPETIAEDPTPAKISPTSPRGIMLTPTAMRLIFLSSTPSEQISLLTTAVTLSRAAKTSTAGNANRDSSTPMPM